jgi:ABC-type multidrug transport system fused ATPase/permease subunit
MAIQVLSRFDYARFVRADAGRIQNTLSGEVGRVAMAYQSYITMAQDAVLILVYVVLAFLANYQFAILVAIGGFASNLVFNRLYTLTKEKSREITRQGHGYQGLLIQFVAFFKYLKATGASPVFAGKLVKRAHEIERTNRALGTLEAIMQGLREPLLIAVVVGVILIQVNLLGGQLGLILLSILFFYRALSAVMAVQMHYNKFLAASGALENITGYMEDMQAGREENGTVAFKGLREELALDQVHFGYDGQPLLQDVSLSIRKNETIAFVGESGSGKTTVMNLLAGILYPDRGAVLVDGVDLRTLDRRTFQSRIGYITQEPVIFNDTIFNNVTFWDEKNEANLQRFRNALTRAHILTFVEGLDGREDALLGNNGINLSGGQRQRISIARELYKNVEFLFMDEATSALDSETERAIQDNIDELKGQYTIIIVAHRLSTIRNVDRVVMLKQGRVDQVATYDELLATSPAFRRMVELQEV